MKQLSLLFISWFLAAFSYKSMAQDDMPKGEKKNQEIIIRKKGEKDINLSIQITGDKVMINGKPLVEFNDDNITINKRLFKVLDAHPFGNMEGMENIEIENFSWNFEGDSKVMLGVSTEKTKDGALIKNVTKGSAAEKAGLLKDDVITKFGNTKIDDPQGLFDAVNKTKPKDEIKVTYKRAGKEKTSKVTIGERQVKSFSLVTPNGGYKSYSLPRARIAEGMRKLPNGEAYPPGVNIDREIRGAMDYAYAFGRPRLGLKIQDTDDEQGVKVLSIEENSAASNAGMKADDIITEIGSKKIANTDEAREALHEHASNSSYKVKAKRNGTEMNFDIRIPKKLKTTNL